jgi:hypothetical protein
MSTGRQPSHWRSDAYNALGELKLGLLQREVSRGTATRAMRQAYACVYDPLEHLSEHDFRDLISDALDEARTNGVVVLQRPYPVQELELIYETFELRCLSRHDCNQRLYGPSIRYR